MVSNEQITQFIAAAHRAGDERLMLCSSGNLSWRVGEHAIISGTGSWLPRISPDKIAVCRIADGSVAQGVKPSMESSFHLGILRSRSDVNVVLHFQSHYATAVACMENKPTNFNVTAEIPCHCGKEIPIVPYYRPGSPELANAVTEAMSNHDCILLSKHGQVVCGKDFDDAYQKAVFFEMACSIIIHTGGRYQTLTEQEIDDLEVYVLGKTSK